MADARSRDVVQNDGYATGAINTHRDSIVGAQYRLNSQPDFELLGADEAWAEEFQRVVEARFNAMADSDKCWFDASGTKTLTGLVRLAVGGFLMTGEVLASVEWLRERGRPFNTAIQMISPTRLSNPDMMSDDRYLRRGVVRNFYGRPVAYWIRNAHPAENYDDRAWFWKKIPATKPWGREQVIHIVEALQPEQTRGIADMVSALKDMRMTRKFKDVTLQSAVVNASYAAAIESELPTDVVYSAMGAGQTGFGEMLGQYMDALSQYMGEANNIAIDGTRMPVLFPGTKVNLRSIGTPGGVGTSFEESLHRYIAASLGLSYEQYTRDYSKTNYSSARASMGETQKYMQSRKKVVADRLAKKIFELWMEEEINAGNLPLPAGMGPEIFYDPVLREGLTRCTWIGASRGQIDELKETQSALMRIKGGLSTYEQECARLGEDYRQVFRQRAREEKLAKELGLAFSMDATKEGQNDAKNTMTDDNDKADEDGGND